MDVDRANADEFIAAVLLGSPVAKACGIELVSRGADRIVLRMPFRPDLVTLGRIVHGGMIATLIDIAGAAASVLKAAPGTSGGATSSLSISYLAPADGSDLTAEAVVVQAGKSQVVSDVSVTDAEGRLVAKALSTNRLFRT